MKTRLFASHKHFALIVFTLACLLSCTTRAQVSYDSINYIKGTFFGKANNDSYLLHMAVDAQGYVYGTGFATSIVTTNGVYQPSYAGGYDAIVFKLDPTMRTLIWATYIGGSGMDGAGGIAVNSAGEVYLSGYTSSSNFPITVASDQTYLASGVVNVFALKLSADGSTLLYSRILGRGPAITQQTATASKGAHIALNPAGEAFVFSHTQVGTFQITTGAYQTTLSGSSDFTLTKLGTTGSIVSSTFFGGTGSEVAYDICYASGKVYCSGLTTSSTIALRSGKVPDASGDCCVFVADDGTNVAPRKLFVYGSSSADQGLSVCYDARANRVCLTGTVGSTMSYTTALVSGQTAGGFIAAIDTALNALQFVTMIGNSSVPTSITTRPTTSTIYTAGYVSGSLPVSSNAFQSTLKGSMDGFMVALDSVGSALRYGSYIGGGGNDYSAAKVLLVDRGCLYRVVFGITTHSTDFPSTANTYQPQKLNNTEDQPAVVMFSSQASVSLQAITRPCNTEANFTLNSTCPLSNIVWKFGDNTTQNGSMTATHIYPGFGTFKVEIRGLTGDGDTVVFTKDVIIGVQQPVDAGPDQIVCKKTPTTQLAASGATSYRWVPGKSVSDSTISNPIVKPETTTTYVVYGKDAFGCESKDSVTITVRDLKITTVKDTSICEGRFAQLQAVGADIYSWLPTNGLSVSTGSIVLASPATTTTYTVVGYNGICYDTAKVKVTVTPRPKVQMTALPGVCISTPVELDFSVVAPLADSDIVSIQWSPAQAMDNPTKRKPIVTPIKDSWYKVTVVTKNGCVVTDSVQVKIQNKLTMAVSRDTTICNGVTVQLRASGAAVYEWSPPNGLSDAKSSSPLCTVSGTQRYRVIGHGGTCVDTQYVTVHINKPPSPQKALGDTTVCIGSAVRLWVQGGDTAGVRYDWYPSKEFVNPSGATVTLYPKQTQTYTVILTNSSGCSWRDSVRVHVDSAVVLKVGPNAEACVGEDVVLHIEGKLDSATILNWSPNNGVWDPVKQEYHLKVLQSQNYHVHIQRGTCFDDADMSVRAKELPVFTLSSDTALCRGSELVLSALSTQPGIQFRWMSGGALDTNVDDPHSAHPRILSLQKDLSLQVLADLSGCQATKSIRVHVLENPTVQLRTDTTLCDGDSLWVEAKGVNIDKIQWSPATGISSTTGSRVLLNPSSSTVYTAQVLSPDGCASSAQFRLGIQPRPKLFMRVIPPQKANVPVPADTNTKIFTPGDSTYITIMAWSDSVRVMDLNFDVRWNAMIFQPDLHNYSDIGDKRFYHVNIPAFTLSPTERMVIAIHGAALQAAPSSTSIDIVNLDLDPMLCAVHTEKPSFLGIGSCLTNARNVTYRPATSMQLKPQPASSHALLDLSSADHGPVLVLMVNDLGQQVRRWDLHHANDESSHDLSLDDVRPGLYTITVYTASTSVSRQLLKIAD